MQNHHPPYRLCLAALALIVASPAAAELPRVAPADLTALAPADFSDDELAVPFYLAHFHRVANSVAQDGEHRGFITLPVWRPKKYNEPYNARVLETHVVFAYFYCTDRPWNPYYGDAAVRARLEAVLDFWCRAQHPDGRFSEYKPQGWNLPATGFATMFMGETLRMLEAGPPIDPELHQRVLAAHDKAIRALLTDEGLFNAGKGCSNQYSGLWGGALAHFEAHPDPELEAMLAPRLRDALAQHQSPTGYWYEAGGCDWAYTLRTHAGNLLMAWHYARDTELAELLVEGQRRWAEWLAYNAVFEPDSATYVINRVIETRTRGAHTTRHDPLAEHATLLRAFTATREEIAAERQAKRAELDANWPQVPELEVGASHAYSPHVILNLDHHRWYPTEEQRDAAIQQVPCIARDRFTHIRADNSRPQAFAFVRRPAYYAVFNVGRRLSGQQRFGLGLLWAPEHGVLLQSQTGTSREAWGTRPQDASNVFETDLTDATFTLDGTPIEIVSGASDLGDGTVTVTYPLGDDGRKIVTFDESEIRVEVQYPGDFFEQWPVLGWVDGEACEHELLSDGIGLGGATMVVETPRVEHQTSSTQTVVADKRLTVVTLPGKDSLTYTLSFSSPDGEDR